MAVIGARELQPVNILGSYVQGREMGRANQLAQQQQMEAAEAARVQNELRTALAGGIDVTTPEGQSRLMRFGAPGLAVAEQGAKIGAERARRAEAETGREKTLLDIDTAKRTEARTKLDEALKLVTASNRQTYPQIYRQAVERYGEKAISELGLTEQYDENLLGSLGQSMINAKDRIDQGLRAREARAAEGRLYVDQTRAQLEQRRVDLEEQRLALEERKASPDYQEIKLDSKTRAKREAAFPKASAALRTAVNDIDGLIRDLEELKDMPGLKKITGGVEGRLPSFFADATKAQARLDKILAKGQFRTLQALRDASPTGGAVGNVSDAEGRALRDSFAALSQTQDDPDFKEQLDAAIADLKFSKQNISAAFDDEYSYRAKPRSPAAPQSGRDVRAEADVILGL
jgi:hypothetical protein